MRKRAWAVGLTVIIVGCCCLLANTEAEAGSCWISLPGFSLGFHEEKPVPPP